MDFQELKDILQRDGGKIIIVENDKAQFVLMSFEEYKKKSVGPVQKSEDLSDREKEIEGLTIDDLPL